MQSSRISRPRRFILRCAAELSYELPVGEHRLPCTVQNINEFGVFVLCDQPLSIGQVVTLQCQLGPRLPFCATIKIRHFKNGYLGARILEVDAESQKNLAERLGHFSLA